MMLAYLASQCFQFIQIIYLITLVAFKTKKFSMMNHTFVDIFVLICLYVHLYYHVTKFRV